MNELAWAWGHPSWFLCLPWVASSSWNVPSQVLLLYFIFSITTKWSCLASCFSLWLLDGQQVVETWPFFPVAVTENTYCVPKCWNNVPRSNISHIVHQSGLFVFCHSPFFLTFWTKWLIFFLALPSSILKVFIRFLQVIALFCRLLVLNVFILFPDEDLASLRVLKVPEFFWMTAWSIWLCCL